MQISILIPVFNRRSLIERCLRSAFAQEVPGLEVIVVDNCSDDGTWEALQSFRDSRLTLHRNDSNLGLFGNFNRCGTFATGDYALFLCSDDCLTPGFLASAVREMQSEPGAVLLSSRGVTVDERGRRRTIANAFRPGRYRGSSVVPAWFWYAFNYGSNPFNYPSGVLFRADALRACLPFRGELGAPADIDMFLRVLMHGDLLIRDQVGCEVLVHASQENRKAQASGALLRNQFDLVEAFHAELDAAGIYDRIRRQGACSVLAAMVRTARHSPALLRELYRAGGNTPVEMLIAAMRRACFKACGSMLNLHINPYLQTVH